MKKLILPLMALILSANVFVSCSSDDPNTADVAGKKPGITMKVNLSTNNNFLKDFYGQTTTYGKTIETRDEKGVKLTVSEVFVAGGTIPRGYVVNRTSDSRLLYFADFDKVKSKMTSVDVVNNKREVMDHLNDNPYYIESGGNVISIIEAANVATTSGFFGWLSWTFTMDNFWGGSVVPGPCSVKEIGGTFQSVRDVTISYRVFWIRWSEPTVIHDVPC